MLKETNFYSKLLIAMSMAILISAFGVDCNAQKVSKLPSDVNSAAFDEIAFFSNDDGSQCYFTRIGSPDLNHSLYDNSVDVGSKLNDETFNNLLKRVYSEILGEPVDDPINSRVNQDIYSAKPTGDNWIVEHPGYPINSALPNSAIGILSKTNETGIFLLNQFYETGSMYAGISKMQIGSNVGDGGVSFPTPMFVKDLKTNNNDMSAFVSPDGEIALFALQNTGGKGDTDLFISFFTGRNNIWTVPKNIGGDINTTARESTPFLSKDKRKLYFASNRAGGKGGTDIYVSNRLNYSYLKWSAPTQVSNHVNTEADESHPCFVHGTQDFFFASNRDGSFDIFKYEANFKEEIIEVTISGNIIDGETGEPMSAKLYHGPQHLEDYLEYHNTFNGRYKMIVRKGEIYQFYPQKPGYETEVRTYNFAEIVPAGITDFKMDIILYKKDKAVVAQEKSTRETTIEKKKVEYDRQKVIEKERTRMKIEKQISLYHVQFIRSKALIMAKSVPDLNAISRLMKKHPDFNIMISGHTDNRGSNDILMKLSIDRANAIKGHLINQGIDPSRIKTVGYGGSRPLNANENERDRRANRRVQFTVFE